MMNSTRGLHCTCLEEIENNLPRTMHCFVACQDQHEIIRLREMQDINKVKEKIKIVEHSISEFSKKLIEVEKSDDSFKEKRIEAIQFQINFFTRELNELKEYEKQL